MNMNEFDRVDELEIESLETEQVSEGHEESVDLDTNDIPETETGVTPEPAKPEQSKEENARFAAARREAEKEKQRIIEEREQDARDAGFNSYAEMQAYIRQQKIEAQRQAYRNAGIDPDLLEQAISNHPAVKQAALVAARAKIDSELSKLKDKPFYKELEPEIKKTLEVDPNLDPEAVYTYIRGIKADTLANNAKSQAEKRTIANIADRKSRGLTDTTEKGSDDDVELSEEGLEMARAFGVDPKKVKSHIKKIRS
jgi:hypothetical protein